MCSTEWKVSLREIFLGGGFLFMCDFLHTQNLCFYSVRSFWSVKLSQFSLFLVEKISIDVKLCEDFFFTGEYFLPHVKIWFFLFVFLWKKHFFYTVSHMEELQFSPQFFLFLQIGDFYFFFFWSVVRVKKNVWGEITLIFFPGFFLFIHLTIFVFTQKKYNLICENKYFFSFL